MTYCIGLLLDEGMVMMADTRTNAGVDNFSSFKKLHTLSCSDCKREEREEWKEHLKQEEQRRNEQYQRRQKELFEQARMEMEQDKPYREDTRWQSSSTSSSSSSSHGNNSNSSSSNNLSYYAYLEETINTKAKKLTLDYLKSQGVPLQGGN